MVPPILQDAIAFVSQPWPWWVAGPMIALIMFLLIKFGKEFGISNNFRVICAAEGAGEYSDFFRFDWQSQGWNLLVALGAMFGGYVASHYFAGTEGNVAHIGPATLSELEKLGMTFPDGRVPLVPAFYGWEYLFTLQGILVIVVGGFLVGFGARYAGGCTSGHAISGMSALQLGSLYAVIGFFAGGLLMTHFLFPLIFQ